MAVGAVLVGAVPAYAQFQTNTNLNAPTNNNINAPTNTNVNGVSNVNRVNNTLRNTNNNFNTNVNSNRQGQFQGQGQGQSQGLINSNTANNGNPSATINNPGYVHTYSDGNVWSNPAASAVAPSVYAASICQSAISGAAQVPLFGISFGSVQGLDVCIKLMLAEAAKTEGRADVAQYFRCETKEFRAAYKATGTPCPADAPKGTPVASVAPVQIALANVPADEACYNAAGVVTGRLVNGRCQ